VRGTARRVQLFTRSVPISVSRAAAGRRIVVRARKRNRENDGGFHGTTVVRVAGHGVPGTTDVLISVGYPRRGTVVLRNVTPLSVDDEPILAGKRLRDT